jgi:hypothetical protein
MGKEKLSKKLVDAGANVLLSGPFNLTRLALRGPSSSTSEGAWSRNGSEIPKKPFHLIMGAKQ